ncbi:MAG: isopentenyl-diphosphate Delta-isomerase [Methanocella sp.]
MTLEHIVAVHSITNRESLRFCKLVRGHPRYGEEVEAAAHRRLREEMGFDCELKEIFSFVYRAELDNDLIEHEYDHVFLGRFDGEVIPNDEEVEAYKWVDIGETRHDAKKNPHLYSYWFRCLIEKIWSWSPSTPAHCVGSGRTASLTRSGYEPWAGSPG